MASVPLCTDTIHSAFHLLEFLESGSHKVSSIPIGADVRQTTIWITLEHKDKRPPERPLDFARDKRRGKKRNTEEDQFYWPDVWQPFLVDKAIGTRFILIFREATKPLRRELRLEPDLENQEPTAAMSDEDRETRQTPEQQQITATLASPAVKAAIDSMVQDIISRMALGSGPQGPPSNPGPPGPPGDTGPAGTDNASQAQAPKVKPEDIGFFDPGGEHQEDIFSLGRYTMYKDIFQFSDRVDDMIATYGEEAIRKHLHSCLRGRALK